MKVRSTAVFPVVSLWKLWTVGCFVLLGLFSVSISQGFTVPDYVIFYTLLGLLALVQNYSIPITVGDELWFETVFIIGFLFTYPFSSVLWAVIGSGVISAVRHWRHWDKALMNVANFGFGALAARFVFFSLFRIDRFSVSDIVAITVAACAYFAINIVLFAVSTAILTKRWAAIREYVQGISIRFVAIYALQIVIGLLLAVVIQTAGLSGVLLFTGLVILVAYSYRDYFRMANHFKDLSIKDELTGLFNHRWVQSWIDEQIHDQHPFSLLMLDIDHFKRYNDIWGHLRGDEALQLVASLIRQILGPTEHAARYSGEEFFIVLPNCEMEAATHKAELIRQRIDETEFPGSEKLPGKRFTVSLGVATYPTTADNKRDLLMMVDEALYKGKFTGRNRVSIYSSVIDELTAEIGMESAEQETVNTIKVFLAILNSKDRYTYAHTERDARYVEALGRRLGMSGTQMTALRFGAFLHDIGKVEIPQEVLTKRGPLTRDEWVVMKSHVELGVKIVENIPSLQPAIPIIRHHHERYDGAGYPSNLAGKDIPIEARILTIADSFDAMTTSRPYQRKRSMEDAFDELRLCSGKQFDPDLVEPFIAVVREMGLLSNESDDDEMVARQ